MNDGVSLNSVSHPTLPWWKRPCHWWRALRGISEHALEFAYFDVPSRLVLKPSGGGPVPAWLPLKPAETGSVLVADDNYDWKWVAPPVSPHADEAAEFVARCFRYEWDDLPNIREGAPWGFGDAVKRRTLCKDDFRSIARGVLNISTPPKPPQSTVGDIISPWHPMTDAIAVKHLGKLNEECNELGAATARCIIQGIDEAEPVTKKPNRQWLMEEIADVQAGINLCIEHFELDNEAIAVRCGRKMTGLREWHQSA